MHTCKRGVKNLICLLLCVGSIAFVTIPSVHAQQRRNWYRSLYTRYDSVVLGCMYGEMCLPPSGGGSDTVFISWVNCRTATIDTTCDVINRITQSNPFVIDEFSTLRMFRMISYNLLDDQTNVFSLPDTTAWTVELWNWNTHMKIATLDSVGICKAVNHSRLQALNGFGPGWNSPFEIALLDLGTYAQLVDPGDSVIIRLKVHNWQASADSGTSMRDDPTSLSLSQWMESQFPKEIIRYATQAISKMELTVYPNPLTHGLNTIRLANPESQHITITLSNEIGTTIGSIFDGVKAPGIHYFPLSSTGLAAGTYFIRITGADGKELGHLSIIARL